MTVLYVFLLAAMILSTMAFDWSSIRFPLRRTICINQLATCRTICTSQPLSNTCHPGSMRWRCVCHGNYTPTMEDVSFPVPFYECQGDQESCVRECVRDTMEPEKQKCQDGCLKRFQCDVLKRKWNVTTTTSTRNERGDKKETDETVEMEEESHASLGVGVGLGVVLTVVGMVLV